MTDNGHADVVALRREWQRRNRMAPSAALSLDFLRRDIAYFQQVDRHGGLSTDLRRRLAALADADADLLPQLQTATLRIKPGSTLVREWSGRTYTVLVLDKGFELAGQRFASLSEVARHITGTHWSGPRFFGLRRGVGTSSRRNPNTGTPDA
ncbi:DUF2924 domain-containing protein [Belnapia rosea]|uniref:DUF2924 domain-containing protein n=1 Tax=Belnapia rosea TaxID=938405 RepID=UPI001C40933C|nr:DUF2924 domain-containing protein [Belnapia rosea]